MWSVFWSLIRLNSWWMCTHKQALSWYRLATSNNYCPCRFVLICRNDTWCSVCRDADTAVFWKCCWGDAQEATASATTHQSLWRAFRYGCQNLPDLLVGEFLNALLPFVPHRSCTYADKAKFYTSCRDILFINYLLNKKSCEQCVTTKTGWLWGSKKACVFKFGTGCREISAEKNAANDWLHDTTTCNRVSRAIDGDTMHARLWVLLMHIYPPFPIQRRHTNHEDHFSKT